MELANLLRAGDFALFETHLKSLVQFYNQAAGGNCEPSLMYRALSAIEAVLITINQRRYEVINIPRDFCAYQCTSSWVVIISYLL